MSLACHSDAWAVLSRNIRILSNTMIFVSTEEKLADSSAANAALSAQLENIAPQLASLEKALSDSRNKLKEEQKQRRQVEQAQDELEAKFREAEGSLLAVREECDAVHEELAFKESELEETRLELEIERERHRVELEDARADADINDAIEEKAKEESSGGEDKEEAKDEDADIFPEVDDAYVKKLEDELELVTEQLIETETRLSQTEDKLAEAEDKATKSEENAAAKETSEEDKNLIASLQDENASRAENETKLREELELTKEELSLTQEELKAVEMDANEVTGKMDAIRAEHREEVNALKAMLSDTEMKTQGQKAEVETFEKTLAVATEETAALKDEIDNLNSALANAKADHQAVVDELDQVNQHFDEARQEAEKRGKESAAVEIRAELKAEKEKELEEIKEQMKKIQEENAALQVSLATAKDSASKTEEGAEEQSELVKELQSQLTRSKEELVKKETEMAGIISQMEEKVSGAEEKAGQVEKELSETKGKLSEAEANLIVMRREKELAEKKDFRQPVRKSVVSRQESDGTAKYRSELMEMDEVQTVTKRRRYRSNSPNSLNRLEIRLADERKKITELEKEVDNFKLQKRHGDAHVKRLEEDIKVLQRQLYASGETGVSTDMSRLSSLASGGGASDILGDDGKSKVQDIIDSGDAGKMKEELLALDKKCNAQRDYNNQLLAKMLQLQGNIQVFCRIRPMSIKEIQKGYKCVVEPLSESELGCFDSRTNQWKSFAFDKTWGPDQSQSNIFQDVEPIALSVVDGFNACIFAYGQT